MCERDEVNEALVDAAIAGEFWVKGGGHDVSLFNEDWKAVAQGENLRRQSPVFTMRGARM